MKKAYLITFYATTRVIIDESKTSDPELAVCLTGKEQIKEYIDSYLTEDNAEIVEDTECPYNEDDE